MLLGLGCHEAVTERQAPEGSQMDAERGGLATRYSCTAHALHSSGWPREQVSTETWLSPLSSSSTPCHGLPSPRGLLHPALTKAPAWAGGGLTGSSSSPRTFLLLARHFLRAASCVHSPCALGRALLSFAQDNKPLNTQLF